MEADDDYGVPAGWYPDPLGLPQLRWWDGQAWTEFTSEAQAPVVMEPGSVAAAAQVIADEAAGVGVAQVTVEGAAAAGAGDAAAATGFATQQASFVEQPAAQAFAGSAGVDAETPDLAFMSRRERREYERRLAEASQADAGQQSADAAQQPGAAFVQPESEAVAQPGEAFAQQDPFAQQQTFAQQDPFAQQQAGAAAEAPEQFATPTFEPQAFEPAGFEAAFQSASAGGSSGLSFEDLLQPEQFPSAPADAQSFPADQSFTSPAADPFASPAFGAAAFGDAASAPEPMIPEPILPGAFASDPFAPPPLEPDPMFAPAGEADAPMSFADILQPTEVPPAPSGPVSTDGATEEPATAAPTRSGLRELEPSIAAVLADAALKPSTALVLAGGPASVSIDDLVVAPDAAPDRALTGRRTYTAAAWVLAAWSLIQALSAFAAVELLGQSSNRALVAVIWFGGLLVAAAIAGYDQLLLKANGHPRPASGWWALLTPLVYLVMRWTRTKESTGSGALLPLVWVAGTVLAAFLVVLFPQILLAAFQY